MRASPIRPGSRNPTDSSSTWTNSPIYLGLDRTPTPTDAEKALHQVLTLAEMMRKAGYQHLNDKATAWPRLQSAQQMLTAAIPVAVTALERVEVESAHPHSP
jgi:hypothetical protein